jgi:hypothetical protein
MSNKRPLTLFTAAAAGAVGLRALRRKKRDRFALASKGWVASVMPSAAPAPTSGPPAGDEAHAPGHRHLAPPPDARATTASRLRPWSFARQRRDFRNKNRGR